MIAREHRLPKFSIGSGTPIRPITLQVYSHFFKHTESDAADRLANDTLNGALFRASLAEFEKSRHSVAMFN